MSKFCPTCGLPKDEHEFVGPKNTAATRVCDLVMVADRERSDGSGRIMTYEVDDSNAPECRTKKNNLRITRPALINV